MTSPPGYPHISEWANFHEVLDGAPLVTAMNAHAGRFWAKEGVALSVKGQEAVVLGSEYMWNKEALTQSAALLWRTTYDSEDARGWSGSVLCQGRPTDVDARAVLFQNFQAGLQPHVAEVDGRPPKSTEFRPMFKGGFLLPEEIRKSGIRVSWGEGSLEPTSLNDARRTSMESKRFVTG